MLEFFFVTTKKRVLSFQLVFFDLSYQKFKDLGRKCPILFFILIDEITFLIYIEYNIFKKCVDSVKNPLFVCACVLNMFTRLFLCGHPETLMCVNHNLFSSLKNQYDMNLFCFFIIRVLFSKSSLPDVMDRGFFFFIWRTKFTANFLFTFPASVQQLDIYRCTCAFFKTCGGLIYMYMFEDFLDANKKHRLISKFVLLRASKVCKRREHVSAKTHCTNYHGSNLRLFHNQCLFRWDSETPTARAASMPAPLYSAAREYRIMLKP